MCLNCSREKPVYLLSRRIKIFDDSLFKLLSHGGFLDASTRCSVKYLCGYKLFFDLIFIVDLACGLADNDLYFCCGF
jgi:hypothetical protein